jgi:hypothetical protein
MLFIGLRKIVLLSLFVTLGTVLSACSLTATSDAEAETAWQTSAHTRWYQEEVPENPTPCAKCHNSLGYHKFLGVKVSSSSQVATLDVTSTTIECQVCHNEAAEARDFAIMPSGVEIDGMGQESNCIECHQGLASSLQLAETITDLPKDQVNRDLSMPNLHSNAVGATFYGTQAQGGAEYPQYIFSSKFQHLSDTCVTCHDPHNLMVRVDKCSACHLEANSLEGVRKIRLSRIDYDGDGDISEGLAGEIETMMENLLVTIRLYAALTEDTDMIIYDAGFLNQAGENYQTWTPDLLQAAYNYNPKYIMQLLYDSIDDLGGSTRGMTRPVAENQPEASGRLKELSYYDGIQ